MRRHTPGEPTRRSALRSLAVATVACISPGCMFVGSRGFPSLTPIIEHSARAVVGIGDDRGIIGSGFRVAPSGVIVTSAHVLRGSASATYVSSTEGRHRARVIRMALEQDLALLELEDQASLPSLVLRAPPATLRVGEWVVVLGRPFGAGVTATFGIVSADAGAVLHPPNLRHRIQLNAAVNPGNSGGPVVDLDARVVGVAAATVPGGTGLGFAVPAADVDLVIRAQGG